MSVVSRYCVECERLTVERDRYRQAAEAQQAARDEYKAERDREARRWLALSERLIDAEAERDRYRAALERIARAIYEDVALRDIAKSALNGGDDE